MLRARRAITPCRRWRWNGRTRWRASVSTMATPGVHICRQRWSRWPTGYHESRVAWSGARLSMPCTQLAVNFELATEAINGEFVKGRKRFDAYALANTCRIHMGRDSDGLGIPVETSEIALNHFTIGLCYLNARVRIVRPYI